MPEMNGLELVEEIRQQFGDIPVMLMTAFGSEEVAALGHAGERRHRAHDLEVAHEAAVVGLDAPEGHDGIADVLVHCPAVIADDVGHGGEVLVHEVGQLGRTLHVGDGFLDFLGLAPGTARQLEILGFLLYQLDFTKPGIKPDEPNSRRAIRETLSFL